MLRLKGTALPQHKFRRNTALAAFLLALTCGMAAPAARAQTTTMDNAAVLKLKSAGLSDDLIATTVQNSPGHYDLSTDQMIALKQAGLSDKVIGAMFAKNSGVGAPSAGSVSASGAALPAGVDEIGVYYKAPDGSWTAVAPEIVNFKSGGVLKAIATDGIVKGDKNGNIKGAASSLSVTKPVTFLIYAPEGTAPNEYQVLHLRAHSKDREFRSETGGVFHNSTGANRDEVAFTPQKIGPRLYQFTLAQDTPVGEYGVLPPGAINSANAASGGKIYTFSIKE